MSVFDPHLNCKRVILVGAGGTGAAWARYLARIVYDLKQRRRQVPQITIIDPDVVELKNVGRQLFTPADVGLPKAEVLAQRFNLSLGLDIHWFAEPFDADRHVGGDHWNTLVCGAVDNHAARAELARLKHTVWVDAGNHFASGQIVAGNSADAELILGELRDEGSVRLLPNAALLFPELLELPPDEPRPAAAAPQASCADHLAAGDQHLLVNDLVAWVGAQVVYQLLNAQPVASFITHVDAEMMAVRSTPIARANVLAYLERQA